MAERELRKDFGKWWVPGDLNAFFGLFSNVLMNVMVLSSLLLFVIGMPKEIVFGKIIPAVGISLIIGNIYYAYMAKRLSRKEQRNNVTALPYGPSVPHYFLVTSVIMLPVVLKTGDPILAWRIGIAWCFIEGLIEVSGAFFARVIQRFTPRGAILGTLAGVSIAFISMSPSMQSAEVPWISFISLGIIFIAWFAFIDMPYKIPAGLVFIIIGTIVAWVFGFMKLDPLIESIKGFHPYLPSLQISNLFQGLKDFAPLLSTAIPMGIYNFSEAMSNVESASAAGDNYNISEVCIVDGIGSLVGAILGSPFPTAVYIGHPGWKSIGGRIGYSIATGIVIAVICLLGLLPLILNIIPLVCVVPILIYIGAVIGGQAFQASPLKHAPAIVLALIPNFAQWGKNLVDSALSAAGTTAQSVGYNVLNSAGVVYKGMEILSGGAILVGLIWAAIGIFSIDHQWNKAIIYSILGSGLSFFGIIHGTRVGVLVNWQMTVGYLILAFIFFLVSIFQKNLKKGGE